jgi:hypothetical protein
MKRGAIVEYDEDESRKKKECLHKQNNLKLSQFPVVQRARNALAHKAASSNFAGMNILLEFQLYHSVVHNVPTSNRVVTWVPKHGSQAPLFFLLLFMKSENIHISHDPLEAKNNSLELPTEECPQPSLVANISPSSSMRHEDMSRARRMPYSIVYMEQGRVCWQGREFTLFGRDAPSNTCLVCSYSDEIMERSSSHEGVGESNVHERDSTCLPKHPMIHIIDVAMYNGETFRHVHPLHRRALLDRMHKQRQLPQWSRVQEFDMELEMAKKGFRWDQALLPQFEKCCVE